MASDYNKPQKKMKRDFVLASLLRPFCIRTSGQRLSHGKGPATGSAAPSSVQWMTPTSSNISRAKTPTSAGNTPLVAINLAPIVQANSGSTTDPNVTSATQLNINSLGAASQVLDETITFSTVPSQPSSIGSSSKATAQAVQGTTAQGSPSTALLPDMMPTILGPPVIDMDGTVLRRLAVEKLGTKYQDQLKFLKTSDEVRTVLDEAISETKKKGEEYKKDQWAMRSNEKVIKLGEKTDSIVMWLDKIKTVGDVASNADPIHIGLPWAGVRFLLTGIMSARQQSAAFLVGIETVLYMSNRLKIYVDYFHTVAQTAGAKQLFQEALVELYYTIFKFLGKALKRHARSRTTNIWKAFWSQNNVDMFQQTCAERADAVKAAAEHCAWEQGGKRHYLLMAELTKLEDSRKQLQRLETKVVEIWKKLEKDYKAAILKWVSEIFHEDLHRTALQGHTEGTGEWIFKDPVYERWINGSSSRILWLAGNVGTGKTKLTAHVVQSFKSPDPGHDLTPIKGLAYFYFKEDDDTRRLPYHALSSLLKQLAMFSDQIQSTIRSKYDENRESGHLKDDEVQELLCTTVQGYDEVTLVIDALDECEEREQLLLMKSFEHIIRACPQINIFISSRPNVTIKSLMRGYPSIVLDDTNNADDIHTFIQKELESCQTDRADTDYPLLSSSLRGRVVDTLLNNHGGMFHWVRLHLDHLFQLEKESDILEALDELPRGLNATYNQIWERMENGPAANFQRARRAIQWVFCARRPLNKFELPAAVCHDPNMETQQYDLELKSVLRSCPSLLETDSNDRVRFTHLSVREYFESCREDFIHEGVIMIATTCFSLLLHESTWRLHQLYLTNDGDSNTNLTHFVKYVSDFWAQHSRAADKLREQPYVRREITEKLEELHSQFLGRDFRSSPGTAYIAWGNYYCRGWWFRSFYRSFYPEDKLSSLDKQSRISIDQLVGRECKMSRLSRSSLALILVSSFLRYHRSYGLQSSWDKSVILFSRDGAGLTLDELCTEQGLDTSASTDGQVNTSPFHGLGIILIEICFNTLIENMPVRLGLPLGDNPRKFLSSMVVPLILLEEIGNKFGRGYASAVDWCLRRSCEPGTSRVWRRELFLEVVQPLERFALQAAWSSVD